MRKRAGRKNASMGGEEGAGGGGRADPPRPPIEDVRPLTDHGAKNWEEGRGGAGGGKRAGGANQRHVGRKSPGGSIRHPKAHA